MRTYPKNGYRIVSQMPCMQATAEIVLSHEVRITAIVTDQNGLS